ncbi:hypothetical protein T069G_01274 [Trichoderma breve]|uniref:Uncharacterized protein n=1 Tax=Trichoderma breve TaxID=2034170 RepID=A0A9W9EDK8_9HYPO|nr:hypothetical protein T069G_01274 [Trichoderma breve]KAJ4864744.1 hypothetical protein T069G_01274 [Trichoderma breve]
MARSLALVALFGAAAMAAQSTTVSLLLPYTLRHAYFGSVIGADSTATTYAYGCAPGLNGVKPDDEDCGFGKSQTVTQGPSTWIYTYTIEEGSVTLGGHCKLSSAVDLGSCTIYTYATSTDGSVTSSTSSGTQPFLTFQVPVTITAGLEKLPAAPGSTATDGSTSAPTSTGASETSQTSASSGAASTSLAKETTISSGAASTTIAEQTTVVSTGTSTSSTTAAPSSTNAAGLMNAQNGLLAGVAAVVGGVMML